MIFPGIRKISKELDLYKSSSQTFGYVNSYFIWLGDGENIKYSIIEFNKQNDDVIKKLKVDIENDKKRLKYKSLEVQNTSIYIEYSEAFKIFSSKKIKENLNYIISILEKNNVSGDNSCHECNEDKDISIYHYENSGIKLCNKCYSNLKNKIENDKYIQKSQDKNYLSGFIGALLFGLPGVLVSILFYFAFDSIAAVTSLVIFTLANKGYKKFKGNFGVFTPILLLIVTFLFVILGNYINIYIEYIKLNYNYYEIFSIIIDNVEIRESINYNIILSTMLSIPALLLSIFSYIKESILPDVYIAKKI